MLSIRYRKLWWPCKSRCSAATLPASARSSGLELDAYRVPTPRWSARDKREERAAQIAQYESDAEGADHAQALPGPDVDAIARHWLRGFLQPFAITAKCCAITLPRHVIAWIVVAVDNQRRNFTIHCIKHAHVRRRHTGEFSQQLTPRHRDRFIATHMRADDRTGARAMEMMLVISSLSGVKWARQAACRRSPDFRRPSPSRIRSCWCRSRHE